MSDLNISEYVDNYWLNLGDTRNIEVENPFNKFLDLSKDDLSPGVMRMMLKPEYVAFTCKQLLNLDISPMQAVILQEMWVRPFPMLIAARGAGKMLSGDTPIRIKNGWTTMENIQIGDSVYGSDGKLAKVTNKTNLQKQLNFYKITLRDGRTIECCEDHLWKVWSKNHNRNKTSDVWSTISTKDMLKKYYSDRKDSKSKSPKRCKEYLYALPINEKLIEEDNKDLKLHPYIVGVLLGDGGLTEKSIVLTSNDIEIVNRVNELLPEGYRVSKHKVDMRYGFVRTDKTKPPFYKLCESIGIWPSNSHNKSIPQEYKFASSEQKLELIKGLMDTDGCSSDNHLEFYTISNDLSNDFLDIIRSLGFATKHSIKESWIKDKQYVDCNRITIYTDKPIFSLPRKLQYIGYSKSKQGQSKYNKVFITKIEYIGKKDGYCISVDNNDKTYITKDYIVTHNSFLLSVYALLKAILDQGTKVVVAGAGLRQSKLIYESCLRIWNNSPILQDIFINYNKMQGPKPNIDKIVFYLGDSTITYIPIGTGETVRGIRANVLIVDEFNSVPSEIFEVVLSGFTSVSSEPVQGMKEAGKLEAMKELGHVPIETGSTLKFNQTIISGTCGYTFEHFYTYWKKWKGIVESKGDIKSLEALNISQQDGFNWRDYSVVRIPVELIPKGFMDPKAIARAKVSHHKSHYGMEYGAVFPTDSEGFFRRSLIETCVAKHSHPVELLDGTKVAYDVRLKGNKNKTYVIGVDPASEVDRFSIVVLEVHENHRRIVYCWTTQKKEYKKQVKEGIVEESDFFQHCARKIRDLIRIFPCSNMMLDAQGGGYAIAEALQNKTTLLPGELPILEIIEEDKEKPSDDITGLHIIHFCPNTQREWIMRANHGMKKDFEDKVLLFPDFNASILAMTSMASEIFTDANTEMETCLYEIEELKEELASIIHDKTASGLEKWDTPDTKLPGAKKGRMRKDRYSALLMANALARDIVLAPVPREFIFEGVNLKKEFKAQSNDVSFHAPDWFLEGFGL